MRITFLVLTIFMPGNSRGCDRQQYENGAAKNGPQTFIRQMIDERGRKVKTSLGATKTLPPTGVEERAAGKMPETVTDAG